MKLRNRIASKAILPLAVAALPAVLLFSSIRTLHEIEEQRSVYLRHRVAMLAARLENLPPAAASPDALFTRLGQDEPHLVDLQVILHGTSSDTPALAPLWEGRELFRTEMVASPAGQVFRAHVPFHAEGVLRIARIGLAGSAADFLVVHARHNVIVSTLAGLVLAVLSLVALWAVRRANRMRLHELEIEHMAHIGKMSAVLAHEIRNPLGTIKGFVQLARESGEPRTRELLSPALAEAERLEALVNDLLAYGRPPSPNPRQLAWNEIVATLRPHGYQMAGARPIRLIVSESDLGLLTDPALLGQVLLNLLRNAFEAIPPDAAGQVQVEATAVEKDIAIEVTDSGPGLSDAALAKLFEPFFTTKAFGTGLGLAISKRLVESLGGNLELRRRREGGTAAIIGLPGARRQTPEAISKDHGNDSDSR